MAELQTIGRNVERREGRDKVTGRACYPDDLDREGQLYGVTVRSPHAHARILGLDLSRAAAAPGVVRILTAEDVTGHNNHGVLYKDHCVFCHDKVRRIGDPVALVLAETACQAQAAARLLVVEYEPLPAVFDPREAMRPGAPVVNEYEDRFFFYDEAMTQSWTRPEDKGLPNVIFHYRCRKGDTDAVWQDCAVVAEGEFHSPFVDHAFLQTESGLAYRDEDGKLVVCVASQYPHFDRLEIADALGVPESELRVLNLAIGGAFGAREDITIQIHAALGCLLTGRPVKIAYERDESFLAHSKRHPIHMKARMGADAAGRLLAFEAELIGDSGAYASWAINVLRKAGVHITGPYVFPHVKVDSYAVYTNNPFTGAMRGFGATQVTMVHESLIEQLAEQLGLDAFEMRRRNIYRVGSETGNGQLLTEAVPLDRCLAAIEQGMAQVPFDRGSGTVRRGRGIAACWYGTGYGNGFPDVSVAEVELLPAGRFLLRVGAAEVGQGAKTVMPQICAEALGVSVGCIRMTSENTDECEDAGTAAATRQTYNTGNAVRLAAESFRRALILETVEQLNRSRDAFSKINSGLSFTVDDHRVYLTFLPKIGLDLTEIAAVMAAEGRTLRVRESFTAQTVKLDDNGYGAPYWPYTFNAYGVEVEVDTLTGQVSCTQAWCAQDVGRALNPVMVEGQIDGGFVMGLGYALYEDLVVREGQIRNPSLSNYIIPTAMDVPNMHRYLIEDPVSSAPFGAKGIGEPVTVPVAPAILNAIHDAIGVRITRVPALPEVVLAAMSTRTTERPVAGQG
ncbi:molybdopterin-dependent oxidoreductase [Paludibacterium sp. THUN1379]|nr:molybdopterin-dependent oxidoreductase [Paludibacterium sp. THUN1379]